MRPAIISWLTPRWLPVRLIARAVDAFARIPASLPLFLLRITVALPFWRSGVAKWEGFLDVSPGAVYLFENEFRMHLFGAEVAYPFPSVMAFLAGFGEVVLAAMLVLGLGARFAALGLLAMTVMIQLTVPEAWLDHHLPWTAMLLTILVYGPGKVSVDHYIARYALGR